MYDFKIQLRKWQLFIKELGVCFYLPFLVNLFCIPLIVWQTYQVYGGQEETRLQMIRFSQYFTPVLVLLWVLFSMIKYIESDGNEIYFVTKAVKWKEILFLYVLYIILNTWPFLIYGVLFQGVGLEWVRIVLETFLFVAAAYAIAFSVKNIAVTLVIIISYAFASVFLRGQTSAVYLYYGPYAMTMQELQFKYLWIGAVGILLFLLGVWNNRHMKVYR